MSELQLRQDVRNDLETLHGFRWPDGLATSCYLFLDGRQVPNRASVSTILNSMISGAKADLEHRDVPHEAKVSVRQDLADLEDWVQQHLAERSGAQTLAWFSCSAHSVQVVRWLPVPLPNRLVLAEDFDDSSLYGVLRSVPQVGLVLLDHAKARVYHADVSRIVEVMAFEPEYQRKVRARESTFGRKTLMPGAQFGRGNLYEKRLQNRREHLLHRHVEDLVPHLSRLARQNAWSHLLIAGEVHAISQLRNNLTADLRRLDVQVADLPAKADASAVKTFLRTRMEGLRHERFHQEYDVIAHQVIPEMRALGLSEVCRAAALNAIQMLLLESSPAREGLICRECGWLGLSGEKECPVCRTKLISSPHIYDSLADAVLNAGGDVLYMEKQLLPPNIEHVAARLRFPLTEGL